MKFKFDGNLDFQLDAINSVVDLFKGQRKNEKNVTFIAENGDRKEGYLEKDALKVWLDAHK